MCTQASGEHILALWEAQVRAYESQLRSCAVQPWETLGGNLGGQGTETSLNNPLGHVEGR